MDIGVLKGLRMAVCGIRCVDLNNNTLVRLKYYTHFFYNTKSKQEKFTDGKQLLKGLKMGNLTPNGKLLMLTISIKTRFSVIYNSGPKNFFK